MRHARLKEIPGHSKTYFHCLSRVVNRDRIFGPTERETFVRYLREYETYCGVRVLTYCILSNHFHVVVEVSEKAQEPLNAEAYLERLGALSTSTLTPAQARRKIEGFRKLGDQEGERAFLEKQCRGMGDISEFMKRLKQRFSQWYNRRKGRKGTLWEERFKSVLVEGLGEALAAVALYVDLNPMRAGLVEDPKAYRWCGYGEAVAGLGRSQEGLRVVVCGAERVAQESTSLEQALAKYRVWLFGQGEERAGTTADGTPIRKGFQRAEVVAVASAHGQLALEEYLQLRVRYFADGLVLGSREFVDEVFNSVRGRFGPKRREGACRMKGLTPELFTLRELRRDIFG